MNCQNCNKKNSYGVKYCIYCGSRISGEAVDVAYNKTVWGRLQRLLEKWDKLTLQNITGHFAFKTAMMLIVVALMFWGFTGDLAELRITESDVYKVTYDEHNDEYSIISDEDVIGLGLYVPRRTDEIKFCGYSGNDKVEEEIFTLEECQIVVERGKFSYMTIETLHRGKVKGGIRLSY